MDRRRVSTLAMQLHRWFGCERGENSASVGVHTTCCITSYFLAARRDACRRASPRNALRCTALRCGVNATSVRRR